VADSTVAVRRRVASLNKKKPGRSRALQCYQLSVLPGIVAAIDAPLIHPRAIIVIVARVSIVPVVRDVTVTVARAVVAVIVSASGYGGAYRGCAYAKTDPGAPAKATGLCRCNGSCSNSRNGCKSQDDFSHDLSPFFLARPTCAERRCCGNKRGILFEFPRNYLEFRFRGSHDIAAASDANLGIKGTLATYDSSAALNLKFL
jgi:hypothetical protein